MGKIIQAWRAKPSYPNGYTDYDFQNFKKASKTLSKDKIQELLDKYFEKRDVFVEDEEVLPKEGYKIFKEVQLHLNDKVVFQNTKTGKVNFR